MLLGYYCPRQEGADWVGHSSNWKGQSRQWDTVKRQTLFQKQTAGVPRAKKYYHGLDPKKVVLVGVFIHTTGRDAALSLCLRQLGLFMHLVYLESERKSEWSALPVLFVFPKRVGERGKRRQKSHPGWSFLDYRGYVIICRGPSLLDQNPYWCFFTADVM